MKKAIVIGAGPAGIGAAYLLNKNKYDVTIFDERGIWGGLCSNFNINNFYFDRFVHLSFAQNKKILDFYRKSCGINDILPDIWNTYNYKWIPHPVQNNLIYLKDPIMSLKIILSFLLRKKRNDESYYSWLVNNYGKYFADKFPCVYTQKYWRYDPLQMETKWLGKRMSKLSLIKLLKGAVYKQGIEYYASNFQYPNKAGFSSFFNSITEDLNLVPKRVVNVDLNNSIITTSDGEKERFDLLVNTSPLSEAYSLYGITDNSIITSCKDLNHTSGYIISIGLNKEPKGKGIFYYIYDNTYATRVNFPYRKSSLNTPKGKFSLQIEIYINCKIDKEINNFDDTINFVLNQNGLSRDNIICLDIKFEKYANIIFDKNIYKNRKNILDYMSKYNNIIHAGRFGLWDYLWSYQALESGLNRVKEYICGESYV